MSHNRDELLGLLFQHSPVPQFVSADDGTLVVANPAYAELVGSTVDDVVGSVPADVAHPDDLPALLAAGERLLRGEEEVLRLDLRIVRSDGQARWCTATSSLAGGSDEAPLFISYLLDITEMRAAQEDQARLEAQMAHRATHDPLTGLPNRSLLLERLDEALTSDDALLPVAVLFIDLDRVKQVNDRLGHGAGDELLVDVGRRLSAVVRSDSTVARLGGDEFVILAEGVGDAQGAAALARRVLHAVASRPVVVRGVEVPITASIGIALSSLPGAHAEGILRDADAAMYRAKNRGRARFELFDEGMRHRAAHRQGEVDELRAAIAAGQLRLVHQPIVDLETGRMTAVEALVRWEHPERGTLSPDEFLPVAEDSGLIIQLGIEVFERACGQLMAWQTELGDACPVIHVNLTPRELAMPGLVELLGQIITRTGVDTRLVCLEITEGALMGDPTATAATLLRMRDMGASIAVDDFGVGHSALAHLQRFSLDVLKVDRSFVERLGPDPEDSAIAAAVVRLAHTLHLQAVAEGVETPEQLAHLRRLGCDAVQGFLISRPVSGDEITKLVKAGPLL